MIGREGESSLAFEDMLKERIFMVRSLHEDDDYLLLRLENIMGMALLNQEILFELVGQKIFFMA